jgi:DNA-binding PadR family transcriptional regulator
LAAVTEEVHGVIRTTEQLAYQVLHRLAKGSVSRGDLLREAGFVQNGIVAQDTTLTPLLSRLVKHGYARSEEGVNRNIAPYSITRKGLRHLEDIVATSRFARPPSAGLPALVGPRVPVEMNLSPLQHAQKRLKATRTLLSQSKSDSHGTTLTEALKDYSIRMELELGWTNQLSGRIGPASAARRNRPR